MIWFVLGVVVGAAGLFVTVRLWFAWNEALGRSALKDELSKEPGD